MRLLLLLLATATARGQEVARHPPGHADQGLLARPELVRPYDDDVDHAWNQAFHRLWIRQAVPAEVAAALPREGPAAFTPGWVRRRRPGGADDLRWFGGDGRLLPLERLDDAAANDLGALLAAVTRPPAAVRAHPELAVWFQHDLLRAAERLLETGANLALVPRLLAAALAVAPTDEQLAALSDPLARALGEPGVAKQLASELPVALGGKAPGMRELLRRSARLFDAGRSLAWSRVFVSHPDGEPALAAMLAATARVADAGRSDNPTVPVGFRAVLVRGLVAVDRRGRPRATPIVFDVCTQVLQNRDPLGPGNPTFTRDGIDFGVWQLERQALRRGDPAAFFRRIEPDDQDLFRDYGSSKHATYRAQCSLCHRCSDTPEPELAGFPVLRPGARASFAVTGDERLRLAEREVEALLVRLAAAR